MSTDAKPSANGTVAPPAHAAHEPHTLSPLAQDLLKEEHKRRRDEIREYGGTMERDQRNGLIMTGVFWSWLAAAPRAPFEGVICVLPAVLMAFFFYRWRAMRRAIDTNAEYLRRLEAEGGLGRLGWETWLTKKREGDAWAASVGWTSKVLWWGLVGTNLLLAALFVATRGWADLSGKG